MEQQQDTRPQVTQLLQPIPAIPQPDRLLNIRDMVSNNRVVATLNQVREQTINRHLHTNRVEVTNRVHLWVVMVVIKVVVGVDTRAVVTKEIVDMGAVLEGTDRVLMDKEAGAMVEEEEAGRF